ncbi:MAG TPA: FMN-binding protein, partial [Chloroflexota bacterium]|nr:FMN-binding protein [Chloroflexota bacterium]
MEDHENRTVTDPLAQPVPRKPGSRGRISRRLVITSTAAIVAVYAVGFARTQGAAERVSAAESHFQSAPPSASAASPTPTVGAPVAAKATSVATGYRDGTYDATGTSRHGDIAAQVTVKGGKIVSTRITGCYTRYPCSRVSDLAGAVVNQQSTSVDLVSGATDSSEAFLQAVDNAL